MNRTQRRLAKRQAKAKPNRSKSIYTTNFSLEFETFDTIERMFLKLRNGEIEYEGAHPVIMGLHGEFYRVLPAMDGWLQYWRELTEAHGLDYDDRALRKLYNSLEYGKPLNVAEIDAAYAVVKRQRELYRALPKSVTTATAHRVMADIRRTDEIRELMGEVA